MLSENQIIRLIFGFKVRYLRQQVNFSYQELSEKTGLSTSYLNDIEKGKRYPKPDKISALAAALNVDYNFMVATNASKKLQPIIDLLNSHFFKLFPLDEFGISTEKLIELFTQTPDRVNAFISTIFKIARTYQVDEVQFYKEALRSFQDMHNNYFAELEAAAQSFKKEYSIKGTLPFTAYFLEEQLHDLYGIDVNRDSLAANQKLGQIRSYYNQHSKVLHLQQALSEAQENFLLARELGFQFLDLTERPWATSIVRIETFEELLNNYKASHFAAALLMDEHELANDIRSFARENTWDPQSLSHLMDKYNVTGEMLLQRFTNILPHHFDLAELFFIRLTQSGEGNSLQMNKDLHLSQLHSPYHNELNEHYCHRWVSITTINELQFEKKKNTLSPVKVDAQISKYWNTDKSYLCISIAKPTFGQNTYASVTLGLLVTPQLKSIFHFLSDPKMKTREVHTTCERCGILDCKVRQAPPSIVEAKQQEQDLMEALEDL